MWATPKRDVYKRQVIAGVSGVTVCEMLEQAPEAFYAAKPDMLSLTHICNAFGALVVYAGAAVAHQRHKAAQEQRCV